MVQRFKIDPSPVTRRANGMIPDDFKPGLIGDSSRVRLWMDRLFQAGSIGNFSQVAGFIQAGRFLKIVASER